MKKLLCKLLVLSLLCGLMLCIPVSAAETETEENDDYLMDWDSVNWDEWERGMWEDYFGTPDYDFFYLLDHWIDWMINDASVEALLAISRAGTDTVWSEAYSYALYYRFVGDPREIISAQSTCGNVVWDNIALRIVNGGEAEAEEFIELLSNFELPENATDKERAALETIISYTEQRYGVEIPRTGDPILLAVTTLLFSGIGFMAMLQVKRKMK